MYLFFSYLHVMKDTFTQLSFADIINAKLTPYRRTLLKKTTYKRVNL